jgi:hypothetical protein
MARDLTEETGVMLYMVEENADVRPHTVYRSKRTGIVRYVPPVILRGTHWYSRNPKQINWPKSMTPYRSLTSSRN